MRNLQKLFSMAMLVCMAVTLFSCSKDDEELGVEAGIVGKWEISSLEQLINGQSPSTFVEQMAKSLGISVEEFEEEYGDFSTFKAEVEGIMEFKDNKTFFQNIEGQTSEGIWSAGEDRMLEMRYKDEESSEIETETHTYNVKSLTSNSAALSQKDIDAEEIGGKEMDVEFEFIIHLKK